MAETAYGLRRSMRGDGVWSGVVDSSELTALGTAGHDSVASQ